ncbi:Glycosyltransferase involved in cell wall bisynthesis [Rhizobiales bacterium GAS188]|nr:Glycosyltransferase involved in cell wall bisynthesis [Rhizobiales bacterium GAS188]
MHVMSTEVEPQFKAYSIRKKTGASREPSTLACVITTFNQAHFLGDAITSVLSQTRGADEVIVVDDGSVDDPAAIVRNFPGVRFLRQENRGPSGARNTGVGACKSSHVCFLDADDFLLPRAFETGLTLAAERPNCALVYGGYRYVSVSRAPMGPDKFIAMNDDPHLALMRENVIGMLATVLFRRDRLIAVGGFDEGLRLCEDYDLYLRMAQKYPVAGHKDIVAEYRWHGRNISARHDGMLSAALAVLDRHEARLAPDAPARVALNHGRRKWRDHYAWQTYVAALESRGWSPRAIASMIVGLTRYILWSPRMAVGHLSRSMAGFAKRRFPSRLLAVIRLLLGRPRSIPLGAVRFGDLKGRAPIGRQFGYDRGTPVDRYYVERFLARNSRDIRGRVLEIGDDAYTRQFGGSRVTQSDIFHVDGNNPQATIIGDLADPDSLSEAAFDCIILTQTLHLLFDMRSGIATLHRALKAGGVLLLTTPGISPVDSGEWGDTWYWSLTANAVLRLLAERFGLRNVNVMAHGNVFAATAFLQGLAQEELQCTDLDINDPSYPVIVTGRAVRA